MKNRIIEHMNADHRDILPLYVKHFNGMEAKEAKLVDINEEEMILEVDNKDRVSVKLTARTELKDMHMELVKMAKIAREALGIPAPEHHSSAEHKKEEQLKMEVIDFVASFKSVIMSTLTKDDFPMLSYSPFFKFEGNNYIFISEAGEHFHNLKSNGKLEIMFIEDEAKSKSISIRKRLRYKAKVEFLNRDENFERIMDEFQKLDAGIKMTRTMTDFHLVKLTLLNGRYVRGAAQAYDITESGEIKATMGKGHGHGGHGHIKK